MTTIGCQIIVCAAIRNRVNGEILCGARHGNCLNLANRLGILADGGDTWECGFIDQDNKFVARREAWAIADKNGQIRRPTGFERNYDNCRRPPVGDSELLFSENLY